MKVELYFVGSVTAEVRGSQLYNALYRENTDSVTTLCCIARSDGEHTCPV